MILLYNAKLVFRQKLELLVFPAVMTALAAAVWLSSGDKITGSKMLFEVISPLILGLLITDILSRETTWKTAEIIYTKPVNPGKVFFLRYFLILIYGLVILFVVAVLLWVGKDFFEMRSFFASVPAILLVTSLSILISVLFGQNIAAFGIIFLFLIEGSAGSKYLLLYLFLETFFPNYVYFWVNRGLFVAISIGLYVLSYYLLKNPERIMR
jgi:hypothetical protein